VKIAHIIVRHLYDKKKVTLQGIGTLHLDAAIALPEQGDRNFQFPPNAFSFEADSHAGEDEDLVKCIMEQTRKIKPLASSDLESYTLLARQFLHIGKPVIIEGVGTIVKNQTGEYSFTPGNYTAPRTEEPPRPLAEKNAASESSTTGNVSKKGGTRVALMVLGLLVLGAGGYALYHFMNKQRESAENNARVTVSVIDSISKDTSAVLTAVDSNLNSIKPDSTVVAPALPADSNNFRIVIKEYTNFLMAEKAYKRLRNYGHKLELTSNSDSSVFRLQMPFTTPLSDTARARDSLRIFFGGKPYIQIR
jgi:hypothetical protein